MLEMVNSLGGTFVMPKIPNTWRLVNKRQAEKWDAHFVFYSNMDSRIVIADHSMRFLYNPSSTDDGLLVWTGKTPEFYGKEGNFGLQLVMAESGELTGTTTSAATIYWLSKLSGRDLMEEIFGEDKKSA